MTSILSLFSIGFLAAGLGTLIGLGGGFLIVPGLVLLLDFPMRVAIIFSLSTVLLISLLRNFHGRHLIAAHKKTMRPLILSCILGAGLSAFLGRGLSNEILEAIFGGVLILVGTYFFFDPKSFISIPKWISELSVARGLIFCSGALSGLLGIGGGVVAVPTLHYILRYSMKEATQLAFLFNFVAASVSLIIHVETHRNLLNEVSFLPLIILIGSAVLGMYAFMKLNTSSQGLKRIFSLTVIGLGVVKILKALSVLNF